MNFIGNKFLKNYSYPGSLFSTVIYKILNKKQTDLRKDWIYNELNRETDDEKL